MKTRNAKPRALCVNRGGDWRGKGWGEAASAQPVVISNSASSATL